MCSTTSTSGVLITDPDGYIVFFSESYGKFLGMDPKAQIGRHTTEVIENSRMHIVAKTGIPEINHPHQIMGRNQIVQRIPIFIDGKLTAVFGQVMFEDIKDVQILADRLNILESKVQLYEKELENLRASRYSCRNIVGESGVMQELRKMGQRAAKVSSPVLLVGESGTGKELFAHAIHRASERHKLPFIRLNCAAIPKDLLEAELFGYEPGAFTGAGNKGKPGKFELAHQGTIFLDEISELPLEMQPKLLRVLEEKLVDRLGATKPVKCDFRLIAATNENLEDCIRKGKFRKDLYYRLNVIPLHIPPLRERRADITLIASHLIGNLCRDFGLSPRGISPEVMRIFENHDWPGKRPGALEHPGENPLPDGRARRDDPRGAPAALLPELERTVGALPGEDSQGPPGHLGTRCRPACHPHLQQQQERSRPHPWYPPDRPLQENEEAQPAFERAVPVMYIHKSTYRLLDTHSSMCLN